jgi:hypothetical protein
MLDLRVFRWILQVLTGLEWVFIVSRRLLVGRSPVWACDCMGWLRIVRLRGCMEFACGIVSDLRERFGHRILSHGKNV